MTDPIETEIKLAAHPAVLEELRDYPILAGEDQVSNLITTYYDTIGGRLRRGGATLRLRDDGHTREQTLKLESGSGSSIQRQEWNAQAVGDQPDCLAFPTKARTVLGRLLDGGVLEPVAITRIERTTRPIHYGASAIEVAFDVGRVIAGKREAQVCELELELVDGKLSDMLALATELQLGPRLNWSVHSKAERCYELAFDLAPGVVRAQPLKFPSKMTTAKGFQKIAWNCLSQLLANYPLVISTGDSEAVHQSRVAIRRIRAALSLFGNIVEDKALPVLRAELRAAASALGPARDLHVLVQQVASKDLLDLADSRELLAHLGAIQNAAVRSAQAFLSTDEFQRLLFDLALWIESGDWLAHGGDTGGDRRLARFAASVLSRCQRKLRKYSDRLLEMPDATRHRLRIEAKKLRYAVEFFSSLFGDSNSVRRRVSFAKSLTRLQDSLGELNDMTVASAGQNAYFEGMEPITGARLAAQLGELLDARHQSRRKLLNKAEAALKEIIDSDAWWKPG